MRVEAATPDELPAVRAACADARQFQQEQGAILWPEFSDASNEALVAFYERQGFRVVARRRVGVEPRLPPHYHGNEFTLLEEPSVTGDERSSFSD